LFVCLFVCLFDDDGDDDDDDDKFNWDMSKFAVLKLIRLTFLYATRHNLQEPVHREATHANDLTLR